MGMPTDQIVVETRVKRQVVNQILHTRVKAVMARIMAVQEDMRDMMGAEQRRHSRLHFRTNHIDVGKNRLRQKDLLPPSARRLERTAEIPGAAGEGLHGKVKEGWLRHRWGAGARIQLEYGCGESVTLREKHRMVVTAPLLQVQLRPFLSSLNFRAVTQKLLIGHGEF